jgi:hypothetical protein
MCNKYMNLFENIVNKVLQEYSNEPRLPFNPIDKFGDKNEAEQFLDWLEDFGKYGKLPPSKITFEEGINSGFEIASKWLGGRHVTRNKPSINDLYGMLSRNGFISEKKGPHFNNRNMMYVERAITLTKSIESEDDQNIYKTLVDNYQNNVGGCWTWKRGKAESYCTNNSGAELVFKGYIRLEDIDWVETDYINCYDMNFEDEIRVKPNAKVEVFQVSTNYDFSMMGNKYKGLYKLPLRGTLIVSATYFGNNGKYNGDYAKIYDATSRNQKYMDRKGNILDSYGRYKHYYDEALKYISQNPNAEIDKRIGLGDMSVMKISDNLFSMRFDEYYQNFVRLNDMKIVLDSPCGYITRRELNENVKVFVCANIVTNDDIKIVISEDGYLLTDDAEYVEYSMFGKFLPIILKSDNLYHFIDMEKKYLLNIGFMKFSTEGNDRYAIIGVMHKGNNIMKRDGEMLFAYGYEWPVKIFNEDDRYFECVFQNGTERYFDFQTLKEIPKPDDAL